MTPMRRIGTFMLAKRLAARKKQPIGTPAFPTAATVAMRIQLASVPIVISAPAFCMR